MTTDAIDHLSAEETYRVLAELYKEDLFTFIQHGLGFRDVNDRTHGEIFDALTSPSKRKLFCLPRGSFKSSIISIGYPIWLLINNPNLRILLDSEVYMNAAKLLRDIKAYMMLGKLTALFGEFKSNVWNEGEITVNQRQKIAKEASVTASGVETTKVGMHYDVVIMDDMNSDKNSGTQDGRQKIVDHYRMTTSILEPEGTLIVVGTRYAANDLIGWILEHEVEAPPTKDVPATGLLLPRPQLHPA